MPPRKRQSTSTEWQSQSVAELKKACKDAGLKTSGTKSELISRLEDEGSSPPTKLKKEESFGTKVKNAFADLKKKKKEKKKAKVDEYSSLDVTHEVCEDFDCMLNQTNINKNNNKFYVIQLLQDKKSKKDFHTWNRWGRVGETGQSDLKIFEDDKEAALKDFKKKFKDKTRNDWDKRSQFVPVPGKYTLLEMDDADDDDDEDDAEEVDRGLSSSAKCKLDKETQWLLNLLFDEQMFNNALQQLEIDTRKMPLGKLSKPQIAKGFDALVEIEEAIKTRKSSAVLSELTSKFYTLIPHDFGRKVPSIISDLDKVQAKKDMLIVISDIELANSLNKEQSKKPQSTVHPLDVKYNLLKCQMKKLSKSSNDYKIICNYIKATGDNGMQLEEVWALDRDNEAARFKPHDSITNRKLLWHGTNVAVVAAILKAGLRIMPHSGGALGKGIYFASENSKSAGYVCPARGTGLMFLAEVALGREKHVPQCDCGITKAPQGYQSVVGKGRREPDPKHDTTLVLEDHVVTVPQGQPIASAGLPGSVFYQSEYLIYDESQVRLRYLLQMKYKSWRWW